MSNEEGSWRSTSLSFDDEDNNSNSNSNNNNSNVNTSLNSSYSRNNGSKGGSGGGSSSRYSHYRRDPPTRVKPWMRDLSVTGSSSGAGARRPKHRFGGGAARAGAGALLSASNDSQSCSNSVSSAASSSYRSQRSKEERNGKDDDEDEEVPAVPREVTRQSHPHNNISTVSHDDQDNSYCYNEKDQSTSLSLLNETSTLGLEAPVSSHPEEHSNDTIHHQEAKTPRVANITGGENASPLDREESLPETEPRQDEGSDSSLSTRDQKESTTTNISNNTADEEDTTARNEPDDNAEPIPQKESSLQLDDAPSQECKENDAREQTCAENVENNAESSVREEAIEEPNLSADVSEVLAVEGALIADEATKLSQNEDEAIHKSDDISDEGDNVKATDNDENELPTEEHALDQGLDSSKDYTRNHEEDETMPESDSTASLDPQTREVEYFDELPPVQPSSYNPMAAAVFRREEPAAASSSLSMDKPTPLLATSGVLLNNAIMEEASEDEDDDDDFDDDNGEEEFLDAEEEGEKEEEEEWEEIGDNAADKSQNLEQTQSTGEEEDAFFKVWPRCMSKSDLPDILFPANWEQQQEHAVESAKAWIRQEQGEGTGDAEDENKKEEDSQSTDEMHYCQFIASLKHCPALTTGFLADGNRNDRPVNTNICFCPCSAYMGEWQSQNRISVGGVNNSNMFDGLLKCSKQQYTPKDLLQHCEEVAGECGDSESRILHAIIHKYLECLFGEQEGLAHMFEATLVGDDDEEEKSKEDLEIMNEIRQDIQRLEEANADLTDKLMAAHARVEIYETKEAKAASSTKEQSEKIIGLSEALSKLQETNASLQEKLKLAEDREKDETSTRDQAAANLNEQEGKLRKLSEQVEELEKANSSMVKRVKMAEERAKIEEARNVDAVASSRAQAEMMGGLCEELKQLEQKNVKLEEKLRQAEQKEKEFEATSAEEVSAKQEANEEITKLTDEIARLEQINTELTRKLKLAEESAHSQSSQEPRTLVYVGETPIDVGRFRIQCQKYFNHLRVAQLKSHCIRDKSPVKMVVQYAPRQRQSINIQALLDECAEREAQDTTYLFRSLDVFNKGHFHSHRLLIPWKISGKDGSDIPRSEFFAQAWAQMGSLKVKIGEKKTEVSLFQESKGLLIPMPNAVMEGMLKVSPEELDRIFAARIAPYYRAIGRLIVQGIGATEDDDDNHSIAIGGHMMPMILRNKLFRGVDPIDDCYPIEELIDHAFTLLGMKDMTRDKALEYFGIDSRDYDDVTGAIKQVRVEIHEMWIKERSLALRALEEGLTLNGLLDLSFCCGLAPLEAVNEVLFTY